jgi:hypothetical protein
VVVAAASMVSASLRASSRPFLQASPTLTSTLRYVVQHRVMLLPVVFVVFVVIFVAVFVVVKDFVINAV